MSDNPSFPIDIQVAKNTKLFKKFMQNKNKSVVVAPVVSNVDLPNPHHQENFNTANCVTHSPFKTKTIEYQHLPEQQPHRHKKPVYKQFMQIERKTVENKYERGTYEIKGNKGIEGDMELIKKYERVLSEYEELKERVTEQRKQNKKQILRLQSEIQSCQKKMFEVTSHEDQLILENRRLKQKTQGESKDKMKIDEENRELNYQVQELKDMLEGQERVTKRREEEANSWRKHNEELKMDIKDLQTEIEKLRDFNSVLEREKMAALKDTGNKDGYVNELREKINSLISQNSDLRDQIFQFTSRLYHIEQQNTALRAEVRRLSEQVQNPHYQYQNILNQPRVQAPRINSTLQHSTPNEKRIEQPTNDRRRRGQFARERGQKKIQNITDRAPPQSSIKPQQNERQVEQQKMRRLDELNQELQKIQDMKAINGNIRRQKIGIERQILQIQEFFRSKKQ